MQQRVGKMTCERDRPPPSLIRNLTDLGTSVLFIRHKPISLHTVGHVITCYPLVSILTALSSTTWHPCQSTHVYLQPLAFVAPLDIPGASKLANASLMQPGHSRWTPVVVVGGGSNELIRDTVVFHSKGNIALTFKKSKQKCDNILNKVSCNKEFTFG